MQDEVDALTFLIGFALMAIGVGACVFGSWGHFPVGLLMIGAGFAVLWYGR